MRVDFVYSNRSPLTYTPVHVCLCCSEHPMDDYYRKLFKSLHKNKEEMLRLMEEQSLFQLSQVGLKVCPHHPIQRLPLMPVSISNGTWMAILWVGANGVAVAACDPQTNALLKEHNQVLASLMLAQNPNSGLDAPNMLQKPSMQAQGGAGLG